MTKDAAPGHTPGPWVSGNNEGYSIWSVYAPADRPVHGGGPKIAEVFGDSAETEANARLISAAPDLLEVVRALVAEQVDYATINNLGDPEKQHNIKWARKVIAKATGQEG